MDKIFEALSNNGFATADYLVFIVYIIILVGMGLFLSRTKKEKRNHQPTTSWQVTPSHGGLLVPRSSPLTFRLNSLSVCLARHLPQVLLRLPTS